MKVGDIGRIANRKYDSYGKTVKIIYVGTSQYQVEKNNGVNVYINKNDINESRNVNFFNVGDIVTVNKYGKTNVGRYGKIKSVGQDLVQVDFGSGQLFYKAYKLDLKEKANTNYMYVAEQEIKKPFNNLQNNIMKTTLQDLKFENFAKKNGKKIVEVSEKLDDLNDSLLFATNTLQRIREDAINVGQYLDKYFNDSDKKATQRVFKEAKDLLEMVSINEFEKVFELLRKIKKATQ